MERKLWLRLYAVIWSVGHPRPPVRVSHADQWVVLVYLWACLHDRPTQWACRRCHWPPDLRPPRLPSQPTMSRRLRSAGVNALLNALLARYRGRPEDDWVRYLDAKPLPVGGMSKDPDAADGFGADSYFRGYKLHAVFGRGPVPLAWEVRPANYGEPTTARLLVNRLGGTGYLVGDPSYDSNPLAEQAGQQGHQLVAKPKRPAGAGRGHHPQSPFRLRSLALWDRPFGRALYHSRAAIERRFGQETGNGLGALPPWVRRRHRVKRWVQAKLLIIALKAVPDSPLAA
ncbi:MAG TPA: transposase [Gemmataceae bacterium]|nr:transposase [Gemmataceae bacterium]